MNDKDFDFEDVSFRPVNKGLGFHQETKKIVPVKKIETSISPSISPSPASIASINNLDVFYSKTPKSVPFNVARSVDQVGSELAITDSNIGTAIVTASAPAIFFAWLIDMVILGSAFAITLKGFSFFIGVSIWNLVVGGGFEVAGYLIFLFITYYLLYFSILDLVGTPGKVFRKLQLVNEKNGAVTFPQSILRSVIAIISFMLLGLPFLMDFQGKLSETKVVHV